MTHATTAVVEAGASYTCEACGGTFTAKWTEAEAAAEARDNFGDLAAADSAVVCDDCYQAMAKTYGWKGAAS